MLDTAFQKIELLVDKLLEKNTTLKAQIATLSQEKEQLSQERDQLVHQLSQLNDDSETLQLEALEQEEKQSELLVKVNALLGRIEEA